MSSQLSLIEGKVSDLIVGDEARDLMRARMRANGHYVSHVWAEEAGVFVCRVGEYAVEGVLTSVILRNNDFVKVVVGKPEGRSTVLPAYAVLRPSDGLLSMPYGTGRGVWAELCNNLKWAAWLGVFIIAFMAIGLWFQGWSTEHFLFMVALALLLAVVMLLWGFFADDEGDTSTAIFTALGFPNPRWLNLKSSSVAFCVFRYRRIVSARNDPHGSAEPPSMEEADKWLASAEAGRIEEVEKKRERKRREERKRRYEKKNRDRYPGAWP
jgi:hypothetical protein